MLYQLSYCPREGRQRTSDPRINGRSASAGLLVKRVLPLVAAVLVHLETLAIVDLGLHRDVVTPLALGAFEGDLHPLV